jgi:hypothetical protein
MTPEQAVEALRKLSVLQNSTIPDILEAALKERDERIAELERDQVALHDVSEAAGVRLLREAIDAALHELGVPGEGYPAPVANAVDILRAASDESGKR